MNGLTENPTEGIEPEGPLVRPYRDAASVPRRMISYGPIVASTW